MLPLRISELERVLSPGECARGLPRAAYVDAAVFDFERAELFRRWWWCVGRECELSQPGEYLLATVAGEELVVVRGADLELRAFFNVCRHRGLPLVTAERGRSSELVCDYHGWAYELSGQLRRAPHMPGAFPRDCHGLRPVRVGVLHGFVFVCLDADAEALSSALRGAPPWLTRPELLHLRLGRSVRYDVLANWKLCIENFQESHHFARVHPALEALTPSALATSWSGDGAWLGGHMPLAPHARSVSTQPEVEPKPWIVPDAERRRVSDAFAFPALLTSLQPDYLLSYQLCPLEPARTRVTANIYFHAAAFAPNVEASHVYAFWDGVNAEDRAICERQQRGVSSRSFEHASYSLLEEGVQVFDQRMARHYLDAFDEKAV
ncbi:MAG: aromatic ring-hydroxylating oxygenase subunit alpha [Myxococcota bacterium]